MAGRGRTARRRQQRVERRSLTLRPENGHRVWQNRRHGDADDLARGQSIYAARFPHRRAQPNGERSPRRIALRPRLSMAAAAAHPDPVPARPQPIARHHPQFPGLPEARQAAGQRCWRQSARGSTQTVAQGADPRWEETEDEMLHRLLTSHRSGEPLVVINDEAHHCYRMESYGSTKASKDEKDEEEAGGALVLGPEGTASPETVGAGLRPLGDPDVSATTGRTAVRALSLDR